MVGVMLSAPLAVARVLVQVTLHLPLSTLYLLSPSSSNARTSSWGVHQNVALTGRWGLLVNELNAPPF
jgi:hypothetical protein